MSTTLPNASQQREEFLRGATLFAWVASLFSPTDVAHRFFNHIAALLHFPLRSDHPLHTNLNVYDLADGLEEFERRKTSASKQILTGSAEVLRSTLKRTNSSGRGNPALLPEAMGLVYQLCAVDFNAALVTMSQNHDLHTLTNLVTMMRVLQALAEDQGTRFSSGLSIKGNRQIRIFLPAGNNLERLILSAQVAEMADIISTSRS
jgi:hypothetical protein